MSYSRQKPPWVEAVRRIPVPPYVTGGLWVPVPGRPGAFRSGGFCGWVTDQWQMAPGDLPESANDGRA